MEDFAVGGVMPGYAHASYAELLAHPDLPAARRLYLDRLLAAYGDDPFLSRLLIEAGRFILVALVVVLDAGHDPARRETWPTLGRLKTEMAAFGLASGRHVDQLVTRLADVGFLDVVPSPEDRRVRLIRPTARMLAHDRAWVAAHTEPLALLYPANDYAALTRGDVAVYLAYRRAGLELMPISARSMPLAGVMLRFFFRASGFMVIAALLQAALRAGDAAAPLPFAPVGERFGVSRTHVRQIVETAVDAGLVRLHGRGGHMVEILPAMWPAFDASLCLGLHLMDLVHAVATERRAG